MIGMDIGTTHCKVAYVDPTGKPNIIPNRHGEHATSSAVHRQCSCSISAGPDSVEQNLVDPINCVTHFNLKWGSAKE